jgi:hypothetical protein
MTNFINPTPNALGGGAIGPAGTTNTSTSILRASTLGHHDAEHAVAGLSSLDAFVSLLSRALEPRLAETIQRAFAGAVADLSTSDWMRIDELEEHLRGRDESGKARGFSKSKIQHDPDLMRLGHKWGNTMLWHRREVDDAVLSRGSC